MGFLVLYLVQIYFLFCGYCLKQKERKANLMSYFINQICSGITSGRVRDGELLYTKILEALWENPVDWREIFMKQSVGKCKQINF